MHVGLNLVYLVERSGGMGTYARELIPAMREQEPGLRITAFVSRELPDSIREAEWAAGVEFITLPVTVTHGPRGAFAVQMAWQWGALPAMAARRAVDVVHGLANIVPPISPWVPTVVTVHDLIWMRDPRTMDARGRRGFKLTTLPSAYGADRVITDSHAVRDDLVQTLRLPARKVDVVHLGMRPPGRDTVATPEPALRERLGLGAAPVVLCLAQKRTHKNLDGLIRAHALLPDERAQLVVVGSHTAYEDELRALAVELGVGDRVIFPDWLDDAELEGLYRLARCFVLPSFEEGFGLPVLEAMARDVPVACSRLTSLPEVVGDAALLFDPHDPADIAACIDRLLADGALRASLRERGAARCAAHSWRATARATLASYRRAIAGRNGCVD